VSFKYDPFGRRIEKVSPTTTSIFAYDGYNLVETLNDSGSQVAHYAQTQNVDELLAMQRGSATDYYEADGLGSTTSLTAANGSVAQNYTYDSFGNTTNSQGSQTNFVRYTGREFDTETNLYYYRKRYYDPLAGRFLSEDPIYFQGGIDFYRYVDNDPIAFADPYGLQEPVPVPDPTPEPGSSSPGATPGSKWWPPWPGFPFIPEPKDMDPTPYDPNWNPWNLGPPPAPRAPLPPPGWDSKAGPSLPPPAPSCNAGKVNCWFSSEFKDPSVDPKFKMCSYSCSDGTARIFIVHILLPCPPTPDRLPQ
jgi:RHS repeat-associated protein